MLIAQVRQFWFVVRHSGNYIPHQLSTMKTITIELNIMVRSEQMYLSEEIVMDLHARYLVREK